MTNKQKLENAENIKKFLESPLNTFFMYRFDDPTYSGRCTNYVTVIGENGDIFIQDWWNNSKVFVVKETKVNGFTLPLYLNKTIMDMYIKKLDYLTI